MWTQLEAIKLCRDLEDLAPKYGFHVALSGGCLYKWGVRKDVDIHFYYIRGEGIGHDLPGLTKAMAGIGIKFTRFFGWMAKAELHGATIDFFVPEIDSGGEYDGTAEEHGKSLWMGTTR